MLWGNRIINLLKLHSSCCLLQMEQVTLHVCLDCYKACARKNESVPIPLCQKSIILPVKTKQNPTLQSDPRPASWETPDHILSLDVYTSQYPLALHKVQWLWLSGSQQSQKFTMDDLSRQIFHREQTSHILVQVTGVHLFTVNLLKVQAMLSLNSWDRTQIFIQGIWKALYV